jgi:hypothetical protein
MAKIQRRSASVVSKAAIATASAILEALPAKPKANWSLRETVSLLQDSITEALSKGYSYEEVSKMLAKKGVEISASSLKSYLSAARRQQSKKKTSRSSKAASSASNVIALVPKTAQKPARAAKGAAAAKSSAASTKSSAAKATKTAAKTKVGGRTTKTAAPKSAPKAAPKTTTRGRKKLS